MRISWLSKLFSISVNQGNSKSSILLQIYQPANVYGLDEM